MTQVSFPDHSDNAGGWVDERPAMTLARETWDRESEAGRRLIMREATRTGHRLVVLSRDGTTWSPTPDPEAW